MKVLMKVAMSGTRDGVPWPAPGAEVEVPDEEGANMCANGLATPVAEKDAGVEKRDEPKRQARQSSTGEKKRGAKS